jgi:hypothetical protein
MFFPVNFVQERRCVRYLIAAPQVFEGRNPKIHTDEPTLVLQLW